MAAKQQSAPWGGITFLVVVFAVLVAVGVKTYSWMQDEQRAPVQVIDFSGR
ncbi:MAG: cell division protein FtsQ, partial [Aestuariibacter sp.]|nr:cell division protein FtsQ [Aestuariibacter sp.]